MTTEKINVAKVEVRDTENGIVKELKPMVITIPKNVVDVDYFRQAVQFHVFRIATLDTTAKLSNAENKLAQLKRDGKDDTNAYIKGQDRRNALSTLLYLLKSAVADFDKELSDEYEDIQAVKNTFLNDNFAKIYAWSVGGYTSYSLFKTGNETSKGKLETIHLHIKNEDKIIGLLKDFDNACGSSELKKTSAKQIELFANETFATNGGELYKKVSFKFSVEKVNKELYSRFKKALSHDGKGNIKDLENSAFTMALQVFYLCLVQLGVPTINGQKIITVEEVADCTTVLSVTRKKKEN